MFKTKSRPPAAEVVQQKLASGHKILPFPQVVGRLLNALKDPNVCPTTLAKIIESDPALSARLLRLANSPVYGNTNVVQSIIRATTVLGFDPLKNLALTFAASSLFTGESRARKIQEQLWNHSLGCATVARQMATFVQSVNSDDAFLAGIFHDVGKLFFYDVIPDDYADVDGSCFAQDLIEQEIKQFEISHEEAGLKLVTAWMLPEKLMVAVGFHHRPFEAAAHQNMAALINIADAVAKQGGIGSAPVADFPICNQSTEFLRLSESAIAVIKDQALQEFAETKQAYSR